MAVRAALFLIEPHIKLPIQLYNSISLFCNDIMAVKNQGSSSWDSWHVTPPLTVCWRGRETDRCAVSWCWSRPYRGHRWGGRSRFGSPAGPLGSWWAGNGTCSTGQSAIQSQELKNRQNAWNEVWCYKSVGKHAMVKLHVRVASDTQTRGPKGPWVAHLRKMSKVTVEPFTEDH